MSVNFKSILENTNMDDIERPKPLPAGSYTAEIGGYDFGESAQKKTPYIEFVFNIESAMEDVDPVDLEAYGDVSGKKLKGKFYLSEGALFMLKDFLTEHVQGVDIPEGTSLDEAVAMVEGFTVGVRVKSETNDDGESYSFFDRTFNPNEE